MTVACDELQVSGDGSSKVFGEDGAIRIELSGDIDIATKATDVAQRDYEKALRETQIFIFNDDGEGTTADAQRRSQTLYRREAISDGQTSLTATGVKAARTTGTKYHIVAVSNFRSLAAKATTPADTVGKLDFIRTRGDLEDRVVELSMCDNGASGAFPLYGFVEASDSDRSEVTVTVLPNSGNDSQSTASAATASVKLRRFVSRIHLRTIRNEIPASYGDLVINRVFIINGYGKWTLGADTPSRADYSLVAGPFHWSGFVNNAQASGYVSAASNSSYAAQVFYAPDATLGTIPNRNAEGVSEAQATHNFNHDFYTMPNPTAPSADNFEGDINVNQSALTRLVIHATFKNAPAGTKDFYYPVTILGKDATGNFTVPMKRNASYDVDVVIRSEGSLKPNDEPVYGALAVTVEVKDWDDGGEIEKKF